MPPNSARSKKGRSTSRSLSRRSSIGPVVTMIVMSAATVATAALEIYAEVSDHSNWLRALDDTEPQRRAAALDRFGLAVNRWGAPLPCTLLANRLRDAAVRERAQSAASR